MTKTGLPFSKLDDILPSGYTVVGSTSEHVLGHWENTNPSTGLIKEVTIAKEGDDYIFIVYGQGKEEQLVEWGKSKCLTYYSNIHADTIEGFTTTFDLEFMDIQLSANVKYGVLVLQMFSRFKDGSGRNNYYAREFYVRACAQDIQAEYIMKGKWKNTRSETTGIAGFEILTKDHIDFLRIKGVKQGPLLDDWGLTAIKGFAKNKNSKSAIGWWANYDLPEFTANLSLNYNKGLIIIAAMLKYKNQPESSGIFIREFFAKEIA